VELISQRFPLRSHNTSHSTSIRSPHRLIRYKQATWNEKRFFSKTRYWNSIYSICLCPFWCTDRVKWSVSASLRRLLDFISSIFSTEFESNFWCPLWWTRNSRGPRLISSLVPSAQYPNRLVLPVGVPVGISVGEPVGLSVGVPVGVPVRVSVGVPVDVGSKTSSNVRRTSSTKTNQHLSVYWSVSLSVYLPLYLSVSRLVTPSTKFESNFRPSIILFWCRWPLHRLQTSNHILGVLSGEQETVSGLRNSQERKVISVKEALLYRYYLITNSTSV